MGKTVSKCKKNSKVQGTLSKALMHFITVTNNIQQKQTNFQLSIFVQKIKLFDCQFQSSTKPSHKRVLDALRIKLDLGVNIKMGFCHQLTFVKPKLIYEYTQKCFKLSKI